MEQDNNLMPHHREVDSPASMHPDDEQVSNEQGGTKILGDKQEEEMHTISFDESQHRVVQYRKVSTLEDHASPSQVEERVIVFDVCKHPVALSMKPECMSKPLAQVFAF